MQDNVDSKSVARHPAGSRPILDPESGEVLVDEVGRRSYITSMYLDGVYLIDREPLGFGQLPAPRPQAAVVTCANN